MVNADSRGWGGSVVRAFQDVVARYPDSPAVRLDSKEASAREYTYRELSSQAEKVARRLIRAGLKEGESVVLPSIRTRDLCANLLGILWAGGNYVFVDFAYPAERQRFICSQVEARFGLGDVHRPETADLPIEWLQVDETEADGPSVPIPVNPDLPAYVVFTSGSTGEPKGVIVPHTGILRLVVDTDFMQFDESLVFLHHSALSFDASTLEIWGPLLNGGVVVIFDEKAVPEPEELERSIERHGVNALWLTSSLFNSVISESPESLKGIRQLLIGGEALSVSHVRLGIEKLPDTRIFNGYGPTENTTFTCVYPIPRELPADLVQIPIGYPIKGTYCEVFDEEMKPVEDGCDGELVAFGDGLAREYLGRPELTAECFVTLACRDGVQRRGYRTGDRVRKNTDGAYEYLGRLDKQVKIDGHRIEPGEIEVFLNGYPGISEARVVVKVGAQGQKRLAGYMVASETLETDAVRKALSAKFPAFMVPHFLIQIESLPKNQNGKLDEAKLPDPFLTGVRTPDNDTGDINRRVAECWRQVLGRGVDARINFLDAGGTSLEALSLTRKLKREFGRELEDTFVFEYPSIGSQARYFSSVKDVCVSGDSLGLGGDKQSLVAVVGMSCRMPGADDVDAFWENLVNGVESITFFGSEDLSPEVDASLLADPNYVKAKGVIRDYDKFDAGFFEISPLEAKVMDPQQRLMLETAWAALEDAAVCAEIDSSRIGVFAGMNWARYYQQYILPNEEIKKRFGAFNAGLANEADFLATRLSYKLNLRGPSINIFSACSTGLVAIAQACAAIENNDCEIAIAGGVSLATPVNSGYLYQEGGMLSKDGHCRPFDAQASGTTFNDGVGCVVLKRLDLAERDGNVIHAIVKGYAINNDGREKASFTAPSVGGQVDVYKSALARSGVDPKTVQYIETHGTATPLGDPIEVRALADVYADSTEGEPVACALGSVKSNIGHTIHAAGIASFIKTVKAVETGDIPPTLFFKKPNPKLNLEKTRFYVNAGLERFPRSDMLRRAAVSSLGVGGTNAHIILEQYPDASRFAEAEAAAFSERRYPLFLSARSRESLDALVETYADYIANHVKDLSLPAVSHTSLFGRRHFEHRAVVFAGSSEELALALRERRHITLGKEVPGASDKLAFMFTGQGSQRVGMGKWLYDTEQAFRQTFQQGFEYLRENEGIDLEDVLYRAQDQGGAQQRINETRYAQPALYLYEYALAKLLISRGCEPDYLIGHSIGEFAAAAIAGVFSFEEGLGLVSARGALMQDQQPGKMLGVLAPLDEVKDLIGESLGIAGVNAPDRIVLSGDEVNIQSAFEELSKRNIPATILHTSHAFHSRMMDPVVPEFEARLAKVAFTAPKIAIVSTASGSLLSDAEAMDVHYWSGQLRKPVLFADAISHVKSHSGVDRLAFVEVGPGTTLTTLAKANEIGKDIVVSVTPEFACDESCNDEVDRCLASLWVNGFEGDWFTDAASQSQRKVRLPTYRFNRQTHWVDPVDVKRTEKVSVAPVTRQKVKKLKEISMSPEAHKSEIQNKIIELLEEVTGYDLSGIEPDQSFSEAGLDSLLLTQAVTDIEGEFGLGITFRDLMEEYTSLKLLTDYVAEKIPPRTQQIEVESEEDYPDETGEAVMHKSINPMSSGSITLGGTAESLIREQLRIMEMQLQVLGGGAEALQGSAVDQAVAAKTEKAVEPVSEKLESNLRSVSKSDEPKEKTTHTPGTRICKKSNTAHELTSMQKTWVAELFEKYQAKYAGSKAFAQKHRRYLADPRTVSGFAPECKEIVFPIVTHSSAGSKLWDVDGNELIDTANGFGPIFFGHSPDFIKQAVIEQIDRGIETGPQSPLAGEVAELFCELTGNERCGFASTGSEAVLGAMRLARTVTGKTQIVRFDGSYHGIFDEVVSRAGKNYQALPGAPGIPRESLHNMLVLPWGDPASLDAIREMGKSIAAVLVEPVQSRLPEFHDKDYLVELRKITEENGVALILDEVVTGFRVAPGGIQERFGIDADIATYGKVVGGGYPIGIIGGKRKYLDALDGGYWEYGDDSIPECGVTFFAGTFVRHPVALAAAKAVLQKIKDEGEALYRALDERTAKMAAEAKSFIEEMGCHVKFEEFSSVFYIASPGDAHWGYLLFTLMVMDGIHVQQYRPNFITTAHSDADIEKIVSAFKKSLAQMIAIGLIEGDMVSAKKYLEQKPKIPPNAKLGRNMQGEPAYFIEDVDNPGNYIEVGKP